MKKSKKNYIAIVLIVLLLALAVGYAAFSQTLTISGTATAKSGTWDVKFTTAEITNSIVTETAANKAELASDGKSITVTVNLATPGDGANIHTVITNAGELDAKLKANGFKVEGTGFSEESTGVYKNGAILVKVPTVTAAHTIAANGGTRTFDFSVEWDNKVTSVDAAGQKATFTITFDYEQNGVTGTFNGTQNFQ